MRPMDVELKIDMSIVPPRYKDVLSTLPRWWVSEPLYLGFSEYEQTFGWLIMSKAEHNFFPVLKAVKKDSDKYNLWHSFTVSKEALISNDYGPDANNFLKQALIMGYLEG